MKLDEQLRTAAQEMHDFGSSLQAPALHPEHEAVPLNRRRVALALAAATALIVVIGVAALLAPFGGEDAPFVDEGTPAPIPASLPSPAQPEPTAGPIADTPLDAPVGLPTSVNWARVDSQPGLSATGDYAFITTVAVGGPGLIAAGADCLGTCTESGLDDLGDLDAAIWTSVDGADWNRLGLPEEIMGGPGDQIIDELIVWSGGYVALGWEESVFSDDAPPGQAIWTSRDGVEWQRLSGGELASAFSGGSLAAVIPTDPGLVAIGGAAEDDERSVMAVWSSTDGVTWNRIPIEGDIPLYITDAGFRDGVFIAVAPIDDPNDQSDNPDSRLGVFRSTDGRVWDLVDPANPAFGDGSQSTADDVFVVPGGFVVEGVAYGQVNRGLWVSPDALNWTRIADDDKRWVGGTHSTEAEGMISDGERFALLTWEGPPHHPHVDDNRYHLDPDRPASLRLAGVALDEQLIAVGYHNDEPAVWIGQWVEESR